MPTTAGVSKYFARGNRIVFAGWGFGSVFRDLHRELQSTHCPATGKTQNPLMATSCGFDPRHRHHTEIPNFLEMRGLGFFILSVSINKSGAEKYLENKIHECEKSAVGRICPLIPDTQYWGYIRMKNQTARFSGFRGANFF